MRTRIDLAVEGPVSGAVGAPAVARLTGSAQAPEADALCGRLADILREHERLVAEVSALDTQDEAVVLALPAALEAAGGWPGARLVVAAPPPELAALMAACEADLRVPVHPDVTTAGRHLDDRPPVVHATWDFAVSARAPGAARAYVRAACEVWDVDAEARESAEIVVTELVTNAVEHASSASTVDVVRRDASFRLAVRDWDTAALPAATLPPASAARGRGLAMVAAVAHDWGVLTHPDGKTVWAEMSTN